MWDGIFMYSFLIKFQAYFAIVFYRLRKNTNYDNVHIMLQDLWKTV